MTLCNCSKNSFSSFFSRTILEANSFFCGPPIPASSLFFTKKSSSEVPERGGFWAGKSPGVAKEKKGKKDAQKKVGFHPHALRTSFTNHIASLHSRTLGGNQACTPKQTCSKMPSFGQLTSATKIFQNLLFPPSILMPFCVHLAGTQALDVLSHHLKREMKSPHLVDFS